METCNLCCHHSVILVKTDKQWVSTLNQSKWGIPSCIYCVCVVPSCIYCVCVCGISSCIYCVCVFSANPYPDVRRRYWNAYMLFYQRISDQNSPVLPKKSRVSVMRQEAEDLTL